MLVNVVECVLVALERKEIKMKTFKMLSNDYKKHLEKTFNRLGNYNRILFENHLRQNCYSYGSRSDTPNDFLIMCIEALEYWKELINQVIAKAEGK
ncbi:MAG: hypothetical protein ACTSQI_21745 [Candidatus Helarchaeota archaeon]